MPSGYITSNIDVAQVVLYAFWIFFAGLIVYLRREDKREGYPLETDPRRNLRVQGYPAVPEPKEFPLAGGETQTAPRDEAPESVHAAPVAAWPGAPLEPLGDPMAAGAGPGAYADRKDVPDLTYEGEPKIVPLRVATDFFIERRDPDPRGMDVVGADGRSAGTIVDVWIDRAEPLIRYLEMELPDRAAGDGEEPGETTRRALIPIGFADVRARRRQVRIATLQQHHFGGIPPLASPDHVTRLEEDRISAWFAAGSLYSTEPLGEPLP